MVTWETRIGGTTTGSDERESYYLEGFCMSEDTKPTGSYIKNGSVLIEIDTGDGYLYDAEGAEWYKV